MRRLPRLYSPPRKFARRLSVTRGCGGLDEPVRCLVVFGPVHPHCEREQGGRVPGVRTGCVQDGSVAQPRPLLGGVGEAVEVRGVREVLGRGVPEGGQRADGSAGPVTVLLQEVGKAHHARRNAHPAWTGDVL
ncbi:hypothetical protein [Streptomyces rugosispiralis]|uniref:Uncharacterized protein n=1 Tax=Streptomyces rugosispiralis TaxID=2967341 RepID=A0ABT1UYG6_9ACTN|nr:hypothetical protein [Streptomyces rugosispiralis]MCQ8190165.1 hypothetical protein [Streptomyces rugosispiralis]